MQNNIFAQGQNWLPQYNICMYINSLLPSYRLWPRKYGSALDHVMACCLTATSYYLNQCWLMYHPLTSIYTRMIFKLTKHMLFIKLGCQLLTPDQQTDSYNALLCTSGCRSRSLPQWRIKWPSPAYIKARYPIIIKSFLKLTLVSLSVGQI